MELIENLMPLSVVTCLRATIQTESHFLDSIPSLRYNGYTKTIKKKPILIKIPTIHTNISSLPEDTIVHVFEFLRCRDLINLSQVCCSFYHLSHNNVIWISYVRTEDLTKQQIRQMKRFYEKSSEETLYEKITFGYENNETEFSTETTTSVEREPALENDLEIRPEDDFNPDELAMLDDIPIEEDIHKKDNEENESDDETQSLHKKHQKNPYMYYLDFRKKKLQIPYIRRRLIKAYGDNIKKKYKNVLKWINLLKALTCSTFFFFVALASIRLDDFIVVPWFFIFIPLMFVTLSTLFISLVLWIPSLQWPLTFYRWIFAEYVGLWTSYSYSMTSRARLVQIVVICLISLGSFLIFFISIFPTILPIWMPFVPWAAASFTWILTAFQLNYPKKKISKICYGFLITLISVSITILNISLFFRIFLLPTIPWSIAFIPMYLTIIFISIAMMKLNFDLNTSNFCLNATVWNVGYFLFLIIGIIGIILNLLKLDGILHMVPYVILMIPFHFIGFLLNIYYYVKAFTNWIGRPVYKNPITIFRGGIKNNLEMNQYIV